MIHNLWQVVTNICDEWESLLHLVKAKQSSPRESRRENATIVQLHSHFLRSRIVNGERLIGAFYLTTKTQRGPIAEKLTRSRTLVCASELTIHWWCRVCSTFRTMWTSTLHMIIKLLKIFTNEERKTNTKHFFPVSKSKTCFLSTWIKH